MKNTPPPLPWPAGDHGEYSVVHLVTEMCRMTNTNQVFSRTQPESKQDHDILMTWPGGGIEHTAFVLLTEAVRREVRTTLLVRMSNDVEFRSKVLNGEADGLKGGIAANVQEVMGRTIEMIVEDATEECLRSVSGSRGPGSLKSG